VFSAMLCMLLKRREIGKSRILSPVRLPFRHTGGT
jgi:hypothetical protein